MRCKQQTRMLIWMGLILTFLFLPVNEVAAQICVAPPSSGLVAWWPGDGNADDIQGDNDGTLQNGATFGPGKVGQAFSFDGSNYVSIPGLSQLETGGAHTVETWIKLFNAGANAGAIVTKYQDDTSEDGWSLAVKPSGVVEAIVKNDNDGLLLFSTKTVDDGQFHHVAMTWNTNVKLYIDGTLAPQSGSIGGSFSGNTRTVLIGARHQPGSVIHAKLNGQIDEVSFYSRVLSANEIEAIFNAGSAGKCKEIEVTIDIKPGSDSNSINQSSAGVIPVAILSSASFDATTVDPDTISLAGASVKVVGKGNKFLCIEKDVNGDSLVDLVCKVETVDFIIEIGESTALLEAQTFEGHVIRGEDSIRIVPD